MITTKTRKRVELRDSSDVVVMLSGQSGSSAWEWASTDNISERGARILTTHPWNANDPVLMKSLEGSLQSRGRIVYCQRLRENLFAVGVKLISPKGNWKKSREASLSELISLPA